MNMAWVNRKGFTIVELLIVIVVIGILAAIVIVAYNGVQKRAADAKTVADTVAIKKAVLAERTLTGQTLYQLFSAAGVTGQPCGTWSSTDPLPSTLPKTHACWTNYYTQLSVLGQAAGMSLNTLRSGDAQGNPYHIDATEGRNVADYCLLDRIWQYNGQGTFLNLIVSIEHSSMIQPSCP